MKCFTKLHVDVDGKDGLWVSHRQTRNLQNFAHFLLGRLFNRIKRVAERLNGLKSTRGIRYALEIPRLVASALVANRL